MKEVGRNYRLESIKEQERQKEREEIRKNGGSPKDREKKDS
jgi:hypothetical protein